MAKILLLIIIIIILLLILSLTVTVRFLYKGEMVVTVDILMMEFTLYPSRKSKKNKQKKKKAALKLRTGITKAVAIKRALDHLFKRSEITVQDIDVPTDSADPAKYVIKAQSLSALISVILSYISFKSGILITEDDVFITPTENKPSHPSFDIRLKTLFISFIIAVISYCKNKRIKKEEYRIV